MNTAGGPAPGEPAGTFHSFTLSPFHLTALTAAACVVAGCAHIENYWREDGPAVTHAWESPSETDIRANFARAEQRSRDWEMSTGQPESGIVTHGPLYFEDPFVDKGSGNGPFDENGTGRNEYRIGWEDYVAAPYSYARYTVNWLFLPVSMVVTPPWTEMESDGRLSRQALGYDHDAEPAKR